MRGKGLVGLRVMVHLCTYLCASPGGGPGAYRPANGGCVLDWDRRLYPAPLPMCVLCCLQGGLEAVRGRLALVGPIGLSLGIMGTR